MRQGLVKKQVVDKRGKRTSVWVKSDQHDEKALKSKSKRLNNKVDRLSQKLNEYPRGNMGIVSENTRISKEYRKDKDAYDRAFAELRDFNSKLPKAISRKWHQEKRAKWRKA